jgi:hypothetical protein
LDKQNPVYFFREAVHAMEYVGGVLGYLKEEQLTLNPSRILFLMHTHVVIPDGIKFRVLAEDYNDVAFLYKCFDQAVVSKLMEVIDQTLSLQFLDVFRREYEVGVHQNQGLMLSAIESGFHLNNFSPDDLYKFISLYRANKAAINSIRFKNLVTVKQIGQFVEAASRSTGDVK